MKIGQTLSYHKEEILRKWLNELQKTTHTLSQHSTAAIENNVPALLDALVEALDSKEGLKMIRHSHHHGLARTKFKEYTLGNIISEYILLKRVIFSILDKQTTLSNQQRNLIISTIDQAIEQAAETYHRILRGVHVDDLKIAEEKAEELQLDGERKKEFIQSVARDLNTPLIGIKASIEQLEFVEVEKAGILLEEIRAKVTQAENLLKDFTNVSDQNIDEDLPVHKVPINILEEISKEIATYRVAFNRKIELSSSSDTIYINADMVLVRRAIANLLSNVLRHSFEEATAAVSCLQQDDQLIINLSADGDSIPQELLDKIFDKTTGFENVEKGWGVGLAFVNSVAEVHQGTLEVLREGDSNIFKLILPLGAESK